MCSPTFHYNKFISDVTNLNHEVRKYVSSLLRDMDGNTLMELKGLQISPNERLVYINELSYIVDGDDNNVNPITHLTIEQLLTILNEIIAKKLYHGKDIVCSE